MISDRGDYECSMVIILDLKISLISLSVVNHIPWEVYTCIVFAYIC